MRKIPVIMDVDTGIDDAVALILAMSSPEIDLKGVTVVAGNQIIEKTDDILEKMRNYKKDNSKTM